MTDLQVTIWLAIVLALSVVFIVVAFLFVFLSEDNSMHTLQKIGFAFLVFGLVVQCVRSMNYFQFGVYPIDHYFPMWITKDIGACVLIYYYAFVYPKKEAK